MDNKNLTPNEDTGWLDDILDSSDYGEDVLKQMKPSKEADDAEFERIMQDIIADSWDLTEAIDNAPPIPIFDEVPAEEPVSDFDATIDEIASAIDKATSIDAPAVQEESAPAVENNDDASARKVRPKRKNGYGLFGLPHLVSSLIWIAIVVTAGISLGRLLWICASDVLAFGREDRSVIITVNANDDIESIADKLYNSGLIQYRELFLFYADLSNAEEKISAGTFELNTLFDYKALVSGMSASSSYREEIEVMIPEGYTCAQIFALLEEKEVCSADELKSYRVQSDYWFLEGSKEDAEYPLEGFLYPDTYSFYIGDTAKGVFRRLLARFDDIFTEELRAHIVTLNDELGTDFDLYDIMIIASMIEKESAGSSENYDISSVIYNRLTNPSRFPYLNIDATIVYAQGGETENIDTSINSPYNTYLYKGLPPTPICNPGLLSIQAALAPADTNYYYYALDKALGLHHFSSTKAQHDAFVNSQKDAK